MLCVLVRNGQLLRVNVIDTEPCVNDSWKKNCRGEHLSDHVAKCVREWIRPGNVKCVSCVALYSPHLQVQESVEYE